MRLVVFAACLVVCGSASAQNGLPQYPNSSSPVVGGAGNSAPAQTPRIGASGGSEILRHRDFTGKACLDVDGFARPHVVNNNLYDHVISAVNNCPRQISITVCYYQTDDCVRMDIPGNERKEAILGTMPSTKDFGFEFREKF
jgi:hypothetical protein